MKKALFGFSSALLWLSSLPAFATTAVLCGNPAQVDRDNNRASVWLILDRPAPRSANEVRAMFLGRDAQVLKVRYQGRRLILDIERGRTVAVSGNDLHSCDGETLFSVDLSSPRGMQTIHDCRCFED